MRVLVTFAVDAEFAPWRKLRHFEKLSQGDLECFCARIGNSYVNVLLTGIGGKKAWVEAAKVLWNGDVDICISSGLAGGLRPEHRPTDVLIARKIFIPARNKEISCDPALVDAALVCGAKAASVFYTADRVIVQAAEKRQLGNVADAVEMESGEILKEALVFGARVVAIRGISDAVEEDLPVDFNGATTESGDLSIGRVLGEVAMKPGSIPALMRFGQQSRLAAERLASFLDVYVEKILRVEVPLSQEVSAT